MEQEARATNHSLSSVLNPGWRVPLPGGQVCWRPLCPHSPAQARPTPPPPFGRLLPHPAVYPPLLVPLASWYRSWTLVLPGSPEDSRPCLSLSPILSSAETSCKAQLPPSPKMATQGLVVLERSGKSP